MACSICQHPKRQKIDQALVAGSATLNTLSQEYGLSTSALHRHKTHLQAKVTRAKDRIMDNLRQGCLFWLSQAIEMVMRAAQAAEAEGNYKLVLQAAQQGTRLTTIFLKHDLPLDDRMVYQILSSPQWTAQPSLLPYDPNIMAISRQALSASLSTPCPETAAPISSAVSPECQDRCQENPTGLVQTHSPKLSTQHSELGTLPPQREKGGKNIRKER